MASSMQTLLENIKETQEALWLYLHFAMGFCARPEQRTKLIALCTALVPDIMLATPKANDSTSISIIFGPAPSRPASIDITSERDIFLQRLSVGHSWMTSRLPHREQQPNRPVFQAHRNRLGQQDQHLTWNTGSGHSCLCNYLIYSGNKNILHLQMLAKVCYWNYTHTLHSYLNITHKKGCCNRNSSQKT